MKIFVSFNFQNQEIKAATTVKELCEILGIGYQAMSRKMKKTGMAYTLDNLVLIKTAVLIKSKERGGVSNFKKNKPAAGMRGYKGDDGILHAEPKKVMMGYEHLQSNLNEENDD